MMYRINHLLLQLLEIMPYYLDMYDRYSFIVIHNSLLVDGAGDSYKNQSYKWFTHFVSSSVDSTINAHSE